MGGSSMKIFITKGALKAKQERNGIYYEWMLFNNTNNKWNKF